MGTEIKTKEEIRNINPEDYFQLDSIESKIKFILQYAILAPSTHNSQPWMFKINGNECLIFYNENVTLKQADPLLRDLYISIGCCLENLLIAAKYFNLHTSVDYVCDPETHLVVRIRFNKFSPSSLNQSYSELIRTILNRKNVRGVYLDREVNPLFDKEILNVLSEEKKFSDINFDIINDRSTIESIARLTEQAIHVVYERKAFRKEMSQWINSNFSRKRTGLPGYSMNMPLIVSMIIPNIIKFFDIGKFLGKLNYKSIRSAKRVCVISSDSDPRSWVKIGEIAERAMLEWNMRNVNTSIYVASIEISPLDKKLKAILGMNTDPQFLFTCGYMNKKSFVTPRLSVDEKIK